MRFFQYAFKPCPNALAIRTFSVHPEIRMRVDDIAFGDVEYLIRWHVQKCEPRQFEVCFEELISYPAGVLPA